MLAPPVDRESLLEWTRLQGVETLLKAPVSVIGAHLEPALRPALDPYGGALTVADAAVCDRWTRRVLEGLGETGLDAVQRAALAHLEAAAREAGAGRAAEDAARAAPPPADPTLRALRERLFAARTPLRERHPPSGETPPDPRFDAEALTLTVALPQTLSLAAPSPVAAGRDVEADEAVVVLSLDGWSKGEIEIGCTLAAEAACPEGRCAHALAAMDAAIAWVQGLDGAESAGPIVEALSAPPWQRLLRAFEVPTDAVAPRVAPASALEWRITGAGAALKITPWREGAAQSWRKLRDVCDAARPADRRVVDLLAWDDAPARVREALLHLVGHPRVRIGGGPGEIVEGRLSLLAEERAGGALALTPAIDGRPLDLGALLARLGEPGGREILVEIDDAARRCTVVRVDDAARRIVALLWRHGALFPQESHDDLLARVPAMQEALPVALPARLMGEEMVADPRPILRLDPVYETPSPEPGALGADLEPEVVGLALTVFVRPVPGGPTFPPGAGTAEVCGNAAGTRVFGRRDLFDERARARALLARLPLPESAAEGGFRFVLESDDALDLLAWLETLKGEDAPAVEWPRAMRPWRVREAGAISLKVAGGGQDWFRLRGTFDLDGEAVQLALLLDAVRRGARYMAVRGGLWVALTERLRARLSGAADLFEAGEGGELTLSPHAAAALPDLLDDVDDAATCEAWSALRDRLTEARRLEPPVPADLKAELRPYQKEGFLWMARLSAWTSGGCLADDMGLGKTVQTIALLLHRASEGPALVVAPTSVCPNWIRELGRFAPSLNVVPYGGAKRTLGRPGRGDVVVTSYGLMTRDAEALAGVRFGTLVMDEAQAIKNPSTGRARAARSLNADFRLALSGTPVENHLGELWSLFSVVLPGMLGSFAAFRRRFAVPIERDGDADRRRALGRLVRPFLLRRTKREVVRDLPPRVDLDVRVDLSSAERRIYEEARLAAVAKLTGLATTTTVEQRRFEVLAAITRLRLLACHPRLHDPRSTLPSAKLDRLVEIVDELREEGHRALVFSQFTKHLGLVREALDARGVSYLYLDGATPAEQRGALVERFQEGEGDLFLVSLKAGGTGLNLTAADHVIHLDPWWNPALEDQATDRAHRIGQKRSVTVMRMVARGTIEEAILELHAQKRALLDAILEGADRSASLTDDELGVLLAEGAEAFAPEEDEAAAATEEATLAPEDDASLAMEIAAAARSRSVRW
jgi:superfamily II DNA or RNA helicase